MHPKYTIAIVLTLLLTAALVTWNPQEHSTAIIIGAIVFGAALPTLIDRVMRRAHWQRGSREP